VELASHARLRYKRAAALCVALRPVDTLSSELYYISRLRPRLVSTQIDRVDRAGGSNNTLHKTVSFEAEK
jgi:hypothetical protein